MQIETDDSSKLDTVLFTQAQILNCVGMMYCGDERLMQIAKTNHIRLTTFCSSEWTEFTSDPMNVDSSNGDPGHGWRIWYEGETRRRTGYSIWVSFWPLRSDHFTLTLAAFGLYVDNSFPDATTTISARCKRPGPLPRSVMGSADCEGMAAALQLQFT